LNYF
jgi:hypothetical protein